MIAAGIVGLVWVGLSAAGQLMPPAPAGTAGASTIEPQTRIKIDARLLEASAEVDQEVLVVLSEQADLSGARDLGTKEEKGRFVFESLTEIARRGQGPLVADLDTRGIAHEDFWISNVVLTRGRRDLIEELARRPDVARVERNPAIRMSAPLPEPIPSRQLLPEGTEAVASGPEWNIVKVNAPSVWAAGFTGQGVVVAGQDTGYEWTHPALKGKYRGWNGSTANHNYNWHDAVHNASSGNSCGSNSPAPCDDDSHGTHTMGIMVGDDGAGNQIGMAPGAKWIGCRNMDEGTGTPARYMECFQFFLAPTDLNNANPDPSKAPDVINNSWSCPTSEGCSDQDILKSTVENVRAAGIAVVVAGGNSGTACATGSEAPEQYEASIDVGATDSTDAVTSYSSRGPGENNSIKPQVVAPGSGVRSSVPGGGYATDSGTSMAAPHASGLAALLLSAAPSLSGNVTGVEVLMEQTAVPKTTTQTCGGIASGVVPNDTGGYGRIDALAAYNSARVANNPPSVSITSPGNGAAFPAPASITIQVSASDSDGAVVRVDFFANGVRLGTLSKAPWTFTWPTAGAGNYVLTAVATDNRGASRTSGSVNVFVGSTSIPGSWLQQDVGAAGMVGGGSGSSGVFTISGSGSDIWNGSDQFHFFYQPLSGDGEIVARVASVQNTSVWAKAGVMIRETLASNSTFADMVVTPASGVAFQHRATTGASAAGTTVPEDAAPYWVRLDRVGNAFTAYRSVEGVNWTLVGSITIPMASTVYVGLAVTSHNNSALCTATFDNVRLVSWADADIGAVGMAGHSSTSGGVYTVAGSGADIWNASDQFHFLYRPLSGDGKIVARVTSVSNTSSWAKAGVMIRETLGSTSTFADLVLTPLNGVAFQHRSTTGASASGTTNTGPAAPYWVRLDRVGNTFTGYRSVDGVTWVQVASTTISMATNAYVGLGVTSHNNAALCTSTFDNVTITDN